MYDKMTNSIKQVFKVAKFESKIKSQVFDKELQTLLTKQVDYLYDHAAFIENDKSEDKYLLKEHPEIKKIVIQNIETIKKIVNIIFDIIFNNLHNIPIGIKLICKVIQVLIYRKFGQVNESKVFDIIGKFLFDTYLLP